LIIDQGQEEVAGYTDLEEGVFTDVPVIIFGDHTRKIKYVDEPFFLGADGVKVLKSKFKDANYKYLYYVLKNAKIPNTGYNRHFKWLKEVKIEYPDSAKQEDIVIIFDKMTRLISLQQKELQCLDDLIKSRFVEMFGDPIANQMEWPIKTLKELSTLITNGNTPKGGSQNYIESGITFLRSQNVWRNRIDLDDVAYIDETIHQRMKKSSLHYKDILITKTGRINTENSSLGRAALFLGNDNSANINGHVYLIRLTDEVIPEYVVTILTGEAYRKYIRKVCVGGIDKRQINVDQVENFPIIMPPIELQQQFVDFVAQVNKYKIEVQKSLDETQTLFDSLMQKYFG
jgi:type I restriction enzyme S subunit